MTSIFQPGDRIEDCFINVYVKPWRALEYGMRWTNRDKAILMSDDDGDLAYRIHVIPKEVML